VDFTALARAQQLERGSAISRDLQKTHAAQDSEDLAGTALRIVDADASRLRLVSNRDLECGRSGPEKLWRILRSDVGDEIAETIHLQDHAPQGPLVHRLGPGCAEADKVGDLFPEAIGLDSLGQISRDRGEDIARVKGVAARFQKIMF